MLSKLSTISSQLDYGCTEIEGKERVSIKATWSSYWFGDVFGYDPYLDLILVKFETGGLVAINDGAKSFGVRYMTTSTSTFKEVACQVKGKKAGILTA